MPWAPSSRSEGKYVPFGQYDMLPVKQEGIGMLLLLNLFTALCSLLLPKPPPGADMLFQFFAIVIFIQELQCLLAQMLTVLQKDARSWSFSDLVKLLLSDTRLLSAVLDHSSSFGAFSFKNLSNMNIPVVQLKTILENCWEGLPLFHSLALMCLPLPWTNRYFLRHNIFIFHCTEKVLLSQYWCTTEDS